MLKTQSNIPNSPFDTTKHPRFITPIHSRPHRTSKADHDDPRPTSITKRDSITICASKLQNETLALDNIHRLFISRTKRTGIKRRSRTMHNGAIASLRRKCAARTLNCKLLHNSYDPGEIKAPVPVRQDQVRAM